MEVNTYLYVSNITLQGIDSGIIGNTRICVCKIAVDV